MIIVKEEEGLWSSSSWVFELELGLELGRESEMVEVAGWLVSGVRREVGLRLAEGKDEELRRESEMEEVLREICRPADEIGWMMVERNVVSELRWRRCWRWVMMGRIRPYSGMDRGFRVIGGGG